MAFKNDEQQISSQILSCVTAQGSLFHFISILIVLPAPVCLIKQYKCQIGYNVASLLDALTFKVNLE